MPSLEERVAYLEWKMEDHAAQTADLRTGVREFRSEMGRRFEDVDRQFTELRDEMGRRFEDVGRQFTELRNETGRQFEHVEARFQHVDARFIQIDNRFGQVDARFAALDEKIDRHFTWLVGIQVAVLLAVVGALVGSYYR